ncbi:MAG TPA: hypothetical protein VJ997_02710 [Longimicrobiales bacterium]|nr:hypothetical protein [Longimicrobiales bacterium]
MSSEAANAIAKQIGNAFANSMAGVTPAPPAPTEALAGPSAVAVNVQVTHRTNCTAGGHIEVLGNMTGNISDTGSGVLLLQVTETISDWRCVGDYVVNGDPYVSVAGSMSFLNGQPSSTTSFSFGGGFKWGTASEDSCQMSLTLLLRTDGTGHLSGTVCGEGINTEI